MLGTRASSSALCQEGKEDIVQESFSHYGRECWESKPDKRKVGFLARGSSDLSLAVKKLKLIGLFMNSAF